MRNSIKIALSFLLSATIIGTTSVAFATETLYKAIGKNDLSIVASELTAGADPNYRHKNEFTALGLAAYKSDPELVELLIEAGADPNKPIREGSLDRPLSLAATSYKDRTEVIDLLIEAGADTEFKSGEWVMTPLQLAIMNHRTPNAVALIKNGVDIIAPDKVGDPALHGAIYQKNEVVIRALLERGANPAFLNDSGENAFQFTKKWKREAHAMPILEEYFPQFCASNPCD